MNIVEKLTRDAGESSIRLVQLTREYIQESENPLNTANALIEELGGKAVPKKYEARIIAQNMIVSRATDGSAFDHDTAFEKAVKVAEKMTKEFKSFSEHENDTVDDTKVAEQVINDLSTARINKQVKAASKQPVKAKKTVKAKKVEKVVKAKKVSKRQKTTGGWQQQTVELLSPHKGKSKAEMMQILMDTLGSSKGYAQTRYYWFKKNG